MSQKPLTWPHLKRFPTVADLKEQAKKVYPSKDNISRDQRDLTSLQKKWVEAIIYLRTKSQTPWVGDERRPLPASENILKLPLEKTK